MIPGWSSGVECNLAKGRSGEHSSVLSASSRHMDAQFRSVRHVSCANALDLILEYRSPLSEAEPGLAKDSKPLVSLNSTIARLPAFSTRSQDQILVAYQSAPTWRAPRALAAQSSFHTGPHKSVVPAHPDLPTDVGARPILP